MGWTAADIPDQTGRTVVITGANSGIGLEATRELARNGATVIMACRSLERGEEAAQDVREEILAADIRVEACDLASLESIRSFADRLESDIDVLLNNAGVMAIPRSETDDGFETQFGVNHLGHFALTGLLLENLGLENGRDSRVVTVSSGVHEQGEIAFDDLQSEQSYNQWNAYAQSKLANVLFAYELERRLLTADAQVSSIAVHPGYANTQLQFRGPTKRESRLELAAMKLLNGVVAQSSAMGALPLLYGATVPDIEGGAYYGPGGLLNMRGTPERQGSSDRSYDRETAQRLWDVSSELTDVHYDLPEPKPLVQE
ncbi:SDR family NAD(P)-dependent oxidoreductase [Natronolimnobius sp. AArcel1]|uniref:oxidoreductase n=1 Tax=Natronolimnobius sp. AArcel1 TaxID=1679093 RepID=UPI0013E9C5AB|nr:oxidoreductase [Natronolimnobius sp. AArcel1]NGM68239.1 SDR family NAD(P)-dependent oxidoreductase [Natronolimnobius sp. AArcel1]